MSRWFRHYSGMMRDEKLVAVAVRSKQPVHLVVWIWGAILESAAEIDDGGRYDFDPGEAAYFLRSDELDVASVLAALETSGRLSNGVVVRWADRQYESDKSTERVRKHRAKQHRSDIPNGDSFNSSGNADETFHKRFVTPPETDTDTDTESSSALSFARDGLETKLREAAGWQNEPAPNLFVTGPIETLLANGADLESDVLPVIRGHAPRVRRPSSWTYFVPIIRDAMEARKQAATGPPEISQAVPFNANSRAFHGQDHIRSKGISGRQFLEIARQRLSAAVARTAISGGGNIGGDFEGQT